VNSFYLLSVLGIAIFSLVLFFPTDGLVISIWFSSTFSYSDLVSVFCWFVMYSTYTRSSDYCTWFVVRCYTSFVCFLGSSDYVRSSYSSFSCSCGCSSPNSVCCVGFFFVLGFSYSLSGLMSIPSFVKFCCSFSYTTFKLTGYIIGDVMASKYTSPSIWFRFSPFVDMYCVVLVTLHIFLETQLGYASFGGTILLSLERVSSNHK